MRVRLHKCIPSWDTSTFLVRFILGVTPPCDPFWVGKRGKGAGSGARDGKEGGRVFKGREKAGVERKEREKGASVQCDQESEKSSDEDGEDDRLTYLFEICI